MGVARRAAVLFGLYVIVDSLGGGERGDVAQRNGHDLLAIERVAHVPVEEWLNDWLAHHPGLQTAANYEYAFTYIVSALALLIWLYIKRPATYRWARNSFIVLNLVAMACFVFYPVAPPRLLRRRIRFLRHRAARPHLGFLGLADWCRRRTSWPPCRRCTSPGRSG